jgi:23S rRNA pseudouridine2604 synthase
MEIRINKYLSAAGVCSRREADQWIADGRITIDGKTASLGDTVKEGQQVRVDGKLVQATEKKVILAVNKPVGVVCTTSDKDRAPNIVDLVSYPVRVYPVGRLDKDSEGLILMTNDGELMDRLLRSRNGHEKEYIVEINKPVTQEWVEKMSSGVEILDTVTKPCKVEKTGHHQARIILTQGLNRQIRRMCEACGTRVTRLKRVRIVNIRLGNLAVGQYRELTPEEERQLRKKLGENSRTEEKAKDKKRTMKKDADIRRKG